MAVASDILRARLNAEFAMCEEVLDTPVMLYSMHIMNYTMQDALTIMKMQ